MSERLNIKNMLVDPEKGSPSYSFDPDRDLSQEERKAIATKREQWRGMGIMWNDFAKLASLEVQLGENMTVSPEERQAITDLRERDRRERFWLDFAILANLDLQLGEKVIVSSEEREAIASQREKYRRHGDWYYFALQAILELQLGGQVDISSEEREAITTERKKARHDKRWARFAPLATFELLLDQQNYKQDSQVDDTPPLPATRNF